MCLVINKKVHFLNKPLIAKDDLYVIKRFRNEYIISNKDLFLFSLFLENPYRYKVIEKSHFLIEVHNSSTLVQTGLHSYFNYSIKLSDKSIIAVCKIPKNSEFFLSYYEDKEIVSNNLELVDILYIPNIDKENSLTTFLKDNWNFSENRNQKYLLKQLKDLFIYINKNYKNKIKCNLYRDCLTMETIF